MAEEWIASVSSPYGCARYSRPIECAHLAIAAKWYSLNRSESVSQKSCRTWDVVAAS